jgi:hypothetical protein
MFDDVGEANEDGEGDASPAERIDKLLQIDSAIDFFGGVNEEVAVLADGEIAFAPTSDIVKLGSVGDGPAVGWFTNLAGDAGDFSGQSGCLLARPGGVDRDGSIPHSIRT